MTHILKLILALGILSLTSPSLADVTILKFKGLIDGNGHVLEGHEIAVEEDKIIKVGDGLKASYPKATFENHAELWALPGIIDAHVHITYAIEGEPQGNGWAELGKTAPEVSLVNARHLAYKALEVGVTSVRDLFSGDNLSYHLRALIEEGIIDGPRIYPSGVGLHPQTLKPLAEGEERNLVKEFSDVANARADEGADWVKIFATSGSADDLTAIKHFGYKEMKAAVDAAHARGLRVAVHSYGPSAVIDALRAGVDTIDHPVGVSDEIINEWVKTDTIYVPTIDHNRYYADYRHQFGYDEEIERNLRAFVLENVETLRRIHKAGIPIAMGSDALMTMFGENTRELEWFIKAGMTEAEAINAAIHNGAIMLGEGERLGSLRTGYKADIIATLGNPLENIEALTRNVKWVMKEGKTVINK